MISQVTSFLQQNNAIEACKVVKDALNSTQKMIKDVSSKNETISLEELRRLIQSFEAIKEQLSAHYKLMGYAVFGKPGIMTAVENIIFGLNNLVKLQSVEPAHVSTFSTYQKN